MREKEITLERAKALTCYACSVIELTYISSPEMGLLVADHIAPHWKYLSGFEKVSILFMLEVHTRFN